MHIVLWLHRNLLEYHVKIYSLYLPDFKTLQWNMKKMLWLKFVHSYCEHISNKTNTQHVHACKHTPINKKWWGFPIVHFIITELLTHNCHLKNETTDLYLYSNNSLFRESRNKDSMKQCDIFGHNGGRWLLLGFEPTTFWLPPAKLSTNESHHLVLHKLIIRLLVLPILLI